jgi:hypothetical protein
MKAPATECPKCGSDLQLASDRVAYLNTNQAINGHMSLHIVCSDSNEHGCDYDCYDLFDFRVRVDKDNPTAFRK